MRFLRVDRILRLEEGRDAFVCKNVSNNEDFFADHFEGRPILPDCLILETCDQAARLLLAKSAAFACLPYRLIPATADTLTARACARMRGFCEVLTTDMAAVLGERPVRAARPGREADGA